MLTPRNVVLAGVPLSKGQACDNDRFPCPVIEEVPTQDSVDAAPAEPAPESKKKPKQAGQNSAMSKGERKTAQAPLAPSRTKRTGPRSRASSRLMSRRTPPAAHLLLQQPRSLPRSPFYRSSSVTPRLSASRARRCRQLPQKPRAPAGCPVPRHSTHSSSRQPDISGWPSEMRSPFRLRHQPGGRGCISWYS
jgi:hypothetical protein